MLSHTNAKKELRLYAKISSRYTELTTVSANRPEGFILCKRNENNHVNGLKMIDYAPGFKLEK